MLHRLELLDTPAEERFDRATRVLAQLLQVPIALVSLVDDKRQWFKSRIGLEMCQTGRDLAFCAHALHASSILIVEDALLDPRFADNPLVTGAPNVRFYAGVPLVCEGDLVLGTLCAIDTQPRQLSEGEISAMIDLARMVERDIRQRWVTQEARQVNEDERRARSLMETHFATIFQKAATGKALVDLQGRFTEVNARLCTLTGYSRAELLDRTFADITYREDLEAGLSLQRDALAGLRDTYFLEKRYVRADGSLVWVEVSVALVRDEVGAPLHCIMDILDIGQRKQDEALLKDYHAELERRVSVRTTEVMNSRATLQAITDNLPILISHVDRNLRYLFLNDVYRQIFGVVPAELVGRPIRDVLAPALYEQLEPYFKRALAGERLVNDHVLYQADTNRIWAASYIPDIRDGEVQGFYVMSQDVTERKQVERALRDKAMRDPLTGLPNRRALNEMLIESAGSEQSRFAVFFLDLDGFKQVNDVHGHDVGDELLKAVALRLQKTLRRDDFVCRLAGDEFVLVARGVADSKVAERIAQSVCVTLGAPFQLEGALVSIGVSVGVALRAGVLECPVSELLSEADAAMYEVKRRGRNGYKLATPEGVAAV